MSSSEPPVTPAADTPDPAVPTTVAAGPQAAAGVTPRPSSQVTAQMLDDERRALLAAVLDEIIPPSGALPGAGTIGAGDTVERAMAVTPSLRRLLLELLTAIDIASQRATGHEFTLLDNPGRANLLRLVEAEQPAAFAALVDHTYRGYYSLPQAREATGYPARPPQPLGFSLPAFDEALLGEQRQRAPFWRRAPGPGDALPREGGL